ncbi:hypothetical protein IAR55_003802 [Kwoniella newhampshirensis]|uniref:Myosin-binding domain-containing protein n=1 Tax=Kwoniella newhampshirensis TaxID=1651941 RepID=A0AAW0YQC0_9TREE
MATSIPNGPLDDYLNDEGDDLVQKDGMADEIQDGTSESGDITLVNTLPPSVNSLGRGWTGVLPNRPSSSASSTTPLHDKVPTILPPDDTFAERFKYLICSSGLLEKDYVPGLSDGLEPEGEEKKRGKWVDAKKWMEKGKERWDLVLTGICLILGILLLHPGLGIILLVGLVAGTCLGTCFVLSREEFQMSKISFRTSTPSSKSQALCALEAFISQTHTLNTALHASLDLLQPHSSSFATHHSLRLGLHHLTDNMTDHLATATSTLLELTDRKELGVLGEMYDIPVVGSFFYSRRANVNDAQSDDNADLESSSPRIPSPRKQSLSLYPLYTPSSKPRRFSSSTRPIPASPLVRTPPSFVRSHSNRTQHLSLTSAADLQDRFTAVPVRTPRISKRASHDKLREPGRTATVKSRPRPERRITEADEGEEAEESFESSEGDKSLDDNVDRTVRKKTSSNLAEYEDQENLSRLPSTPTTPVIEMLRGTPSPFPRVSSPLARRTSHVSEGGLVRLRSATTATAGKQLTSGLLPSPFDHDLSSTPLRSTLSLEPGPNPKRRSLQNMPYYPSSDDDRAAASAGLTRTQSMPFSDLQALRTASSTGSRSRRSSLNPGVQMPSSPLGIGFPTSFPLDERSSLGAVTLLSPASSVHRRRVESVSPLTTPALTASCLGIHLKRRRLACCLLGLQFSGIDRAYWKEVKETLEAMTAGMVKERTVLERVLREAEREALLAQELNTIVSPGFQRGSERVGGQSTFSLPDILNGTKDFAPRTSDEAIVVEQVDRIAATLVKAWSDLRSVSEGLQKKDEHSDGGFEAWGNIRERLGEMVRDWDRGREAIARIQAGNPTHEAEIHVETGRQRVGEDLPEFLKAWEESSRDTSLDTSRTVFDNDLAESALVDDAEVYEKTEKLPPAGKDTVFESVSLIPIQSEHKALLSKLSREERIVLMREARDRGLSVEILHRGRNGGEVNMAEEVDKEMRKKGGEVVDELRGVIGVIRRMKGEGEGEEKQTSSGTEAPYEHGLNWKAGLGKGITDKETRPDAMNKNNDQTHDDRHENENGQESRIETQQVAPSFRNRLDNLTDHRDSVGPGINLRAGFDMEELKRGLGLKMPQLGAMVGREEGMEFD